MEKTWPHKNMWTSVRGHSHIEAPSPFLLSLRALHQPTQPEARRPRSPIDGMPLGALSRRRKEHSGPGGTVEDTQCMVMTQWWWWISIISVNYSRILLLTAYYKIKDSSIWDPKHNPVKSINMVQAQLVDGILSRCHLSLVYNFVSSESNNLL